MQFTNKIATSRQELIRLARGNDNGEATWYYVKITGAKFPIYQQRMKMGEQVNLGDYGQVLYSGWGDNPPEEITRKIVEMFG